MPKRQSEHRSHLTPFINRYISMLKTEEQAIGEVFDLQKELDTFKLVANDLILQVNRLTREGFTQLRLNPDFQERGGDIEDIDKIKREHIRRASMHIIRAREALADNLEEEYNRSLAELDCIFEHGTSTPEQTVEPNRQLPVAM